MGKMSQKKLETLSKLGRPHGDLVRKRISDPGLIFGSEEYFTKAVFPSDLSDPDGKRWSSMKDIRSKHTDFTLESVLRTQMSLAKLRIKRSKNS